MNKVRSALLARIAPGDAELVNQKSLTKEPSGFLRFLGVIAAMAIVGWGGNWIMHASDPPQPEETSEERTARIQAELDAARAANATKWASMPKYRHEFQSAVEGKCLGGLTAAVGVPDSTQQSGRYEYWYYRGKTRDATTGRTDSIAQVVVEYGCARSVNFY